MGVSVGEISYSCLRHVEGLAQKLSEFRISGNPDLRKSGFPRFRISRYPEFRTSGSPEIRIPGIPDFWNSGCPNSGFPNSGIPDFRNSRSPEFRIKPANDPEMLHTKYTRLTDPDFFIFVCQMAYHYRVPSLQQSSRLGLRHVGSQSHTNFMGS